MARNTFDDPFEAVKYGSYFRDRRIGHDRVEPGDVAADPFPHPAEVA